MKKTILKRKTNFLLKCFLMVALVPSIKVGAQTSSFCGIQADTTQNPGQSVSAQPTNSMQLLKDFIPGANDRTIEIRVKIYIFAPPTLTNGVWTYAGHASTQSDAQYALDVANATYSNMPAPTQPAPGVTSITDAKIKLVMAGFQIIQSAAIYSAVSTANLSHNDPTCINLYFGDCEPAGMQCASNSGKDYPITPGVYPYNYAEFRPAFGASNPNFENISAKGGVIAHEVGHVLGLDHINKWSFGNPPTLYYDQSYISPDFGCCTYVNVRDFTYDEAVWDPCPGTINPGTGLMGTGSNNLMNAQAGCGNQYLSPQQVALIHYNLRTSLKDLLTASGYTAATTVNSAFDYNVTSNETFQDGDRYFKGNIVVKAGKRLTVKCGLAMTNGAKIIVEKTGELFVDGGTITNISGRVWDGIYVWGDQSQPQTLSSSGIGGQYQGLARIYNGTISHAKIGIRNYNQAYVDFGGIIVGVNANFTNNYMDVEMIGTNSTATVHTSASRFYGCNFRTTGLIGDNYPPLTHVNLYRSVGAGFYGCTFEYTTTATLNSHGSGISSVNSSYTVDKWGNIRPVFKNLLKGVYVNNYIATRTPLIRNTLFTDNLQYGAYFMNANTLAFQTNTVQFSPGVAIQAGVYLNNCKYYKIKNNLFVQPGTGFNPGDPGLCIYNSLAGAHEVYRNTFSHLLMGINCIDNNSGTTNITDGLKMNCNDFVQSPNLYDIALTSYTMAPSVMKNQGDILNPNASNVVRNMYGASCNAAQQNKWYIHSSSTKVINHGCNATATNGASTKPTPQPACSRTVVNVVTIPSALNFTAVCGANPPSSGGSGTTSAQRLANMNEYITELQNDNGENQYHFEIQSTVASKLNLFLTDTISNNLDSVITILESNQGAMEDADLQAVFAYIAKGDYATAQGKVDAMDVSRSDWMELLSKIIELEQDAEGIYRLNTNSSDRNFLLNYATTQGKDGQSIAQAILKAACDSNYTEPHTFPESYSPRMTEPDQVYTEKLADQAEKIEIYPNPTKTGVNIYYNSQSEGNVKIEVKDLLGKLIYTNFIYRGLSNQFIPMNELNGGMYLITLTRDKEVIYKTKIIKEE